MAAKPRVLIASQPTAWRILRPMLEEVFDLVAVQTTSEALKVLESGPAPSELIISTIAFDDSRMVEFLYAAKSRQDTRAIPFVCCRVLPTVLSPDAVARVAEVCMLGGAAEFIDGPALDQRSAVAVLRAAVMRHIAARAAKRD
jgi:hypothetical protein